MSGSQHPLAGLTVVEMGSRVTAPYIAKLFVDAGADVIKVESPSGDPFRRWSASGTVIAPDADGAWFRFLNAGKRSVVLDLTEADGSARLDRLLDAADLVLDDHGPAPARALGIDPDALRVDHPSLVVATLTPFGTTGPWADRPANDFVLQALVGATDGRGVPGSEPVAVGGDLGDFVAAALPAPAILAVTLAARHTGEGAHLDCSQYEAMMHAFQTYRPIFDAFAPDYRPGRQIEIPSVEPAADGEIGYCCITGQQWQDFCVMIGAPEWIDDEELAGFDGRMRRRHEVWDRIRSFTRSHTVDELVERAADFRIPTGPIGTGDVIASLDHFVERRVFVDNPHGFVQPRPPYQFSTTRLAPLRPAPTLGDEGRPPAAAEGPRLGSSTNRPLEGVSVVDLSAFWAGPFSTNLLRLLGAEVIKVEGHVRLDGMRWASGLQRQPRWEWSPVYHGANVGKTVVNLDLGTETGRGLLEQLISRADVVIENFSPRVTEGWGITWERVHALNPAAIFVRVPAFGLDGPWRDRVGFAMTMEQVSGLASRTGHVDGPPMVPKGPVDTIAGMHVTFAVILALVERQRRGEGQLVEMALIEGALQAAAEQVVEFSAYGSTLSRTGNRSPAASPQRVYETAERDMWLALSVETDAQWRGLVEVVGTDLTGLDRHDDVDAVDRVLARWVGDNRPDEGAGQLWRAGVPAAPCVHVNDSGRSPQHDARGFLQVINHPVAGPVPYLSHPFLLDGKHIALGAAAPLLGQHNHEVLAGLGCGPDEIRDLEAAGITGDWPAMVPRPDAGNGGDDGEDPRS